MEILIPILILGSLGMVFGVGLAIASKRLAVYVDPRLEKIHGLLPGANCGACGGAGCFGFAEGLLSGKFNMDACKVSEETAREEVSYVLGQKIEKRVKKVAVLRCFGGIQAKDKFIYKGIKDCLAASLVLGGQKECAYGCLGFGACEKACAFGAIKMSKDGLPNIDAAKCKACNKCVLACPKKLFSLIAVTHTVYVACNSYNSGKDTRIVCPAGCIACKLCEKACKFDSIHVINNLAVIDYHKCVSCGECVKACPVKCIKIRSF
ncbi:MAG: 4Fe-4S binding protein [Candidatus Omnitrophota bacterium]|nr:4Fe-4S binding protein [Candidatus Omnitrophota bacterium]